MNRLLIVSNRLPVTVEKRGGRVVFHPSVGGLATALASLDGRERLWLGWPDIASGSVTPEERVDIRARLMDEHSCIPVFLTQKDVSGFYHGFSNRSLWPLFHHFARYAEFEADNWRSYERVNRTFCDTVLEVAAPGDVIWVHDYQLMLLPRMLREAMPDASIGFFLHIPFPSWEVYRMLPWRRELIEGVMGADLVGFHTFDYAHHFTASVRNLLGLDDRNGRLVSGDRLVTVDAFPIGIDPPAFEAAVRRPAAVRQARRARAGDEEMRLVLSVDRLDYTKGIPERLRAFDAFLEHHPEWRRRVRLLCVAVPSRTRVERYRRLKDEVDGLVGAVNGRWGTVDWTPVTYLYRSLSFESLVGLYAAADVALVTPLRDGMNLVAKEYLASRTGDDGVLVLSEMAGAVRELGEAIVVNPYDQEAVADALLAALTMPEEEQVRRNRPMRERLRRYDVRRWAEDFLRTLDETKCIQCAYAEYALTARQRKEMLDHAKRASSRVFVLDYDGTLVPFASRPEEARPDGALLDTLSHLAADPDTSVVVISGRDRRTLTDWLGSLDVTLVAEHGAWVRERGGEWVTAVPLSGEWKESVRPFLELAADRTAGAFVEEKDFSLVWHYRMAQTEQAAMRVRELVETISPLAGTLGLVLLEGNHVLEVKDAAVDKGRVGHRWMQVPPDGFLLVAGDDRTDEAMFEVAPEGAWTVKVGAGSTRARVSVRSWRDVRDLVRASIEAVG